MGILPSAKFKWQVISAPTTDHQIPSAFDYVSSTGYAILFRISWCYYFCCYIKAKRAYLKRSKNFIKGFILLNILRMFSTWQILKVSTYFSLPRLKIPMRVQLVGLSQVDEGMFSFGNFETKPLLSKSSNCWRCYLNNMEVVSLHLGRKIFMLSWELCQEFVQNHFLPNPLICERKIHSKFCLWAIHFKIWPLGYIFTFCPRATF